MDCPWAKNSEKSVMNQKKRIFALGFFDGVHLGHQALLERCCQMAWEMGCQAAAITFDRHPQSLFAPTPGLLNTLPDRKQLLADFGAEYIRVLPVTAQVMATPWEDFLDLLRADGAVGFVCGYDFRFGHQGRGDAAGLQGYCRRNGLACAIVPRCVADGERISSTRIRGLIEAGEMESAVRLLGHSHILSGAVIPGKQIGRQIGVPTANLPLPEGLAVPRFGVYACKARTDGKVYRAVTNVGTRPTVSGQGITVEPWLLGYHGDLYGKELTLEFCSFLRPEKKFPSLDALQAQIRRDAAQTEQFFAGKV